MKLKKLTIFSWIITIVLPIFYSIFVKKVELEGASLGVNQLENSSDAINELNKYSSIEYTLFAAIIGFIILSIVLTIVDLSKNKK